MSGKAFILRISPNHVDRVDEAVSANELIIGWANAEGLLKPGLDWDDFKRIIAAAYPDEKPSWPGKAASHMWRFVREMGPGDLVMVPRHNEIYFAEIQGDATFDAARQKEDTSYRREASWLNGKQPIAKSDLSENLIDKINSLQTTSMEITGLYGEVAAAANFRAAGEDWTQAELDATVADYRDMLRLEIAGQTFNKSEHRRALLDKVHRSEGAIEFKHQNISAVLEEIGLPWIRGYKPRHNYQDALAQTVARIIANPDSELPPPVAPATDIDFDKVFVPPPAMDKPGKDSGSQVGKRIARKIDQAARDARNRDLGKAGENFVVNVEMKKLAHLPHLANLVSNHATEKGDGLGYDVLSFDEKGRELFIEVKTTQGGIAVPFFISGGELEAAKELGAGYRLYRVFEFGKEPKIFVLEPDLADKLDVSAANYRATVRNSSRPSEIFRYFAYGSNMSTKRLQERTPSCKVIGKAVLPSHQLRFHKRSADGSGKCDAFYTGQLDDRVIGVVFDIPKGEKAKLDRAEGLGNGYDEKLVQVTLYDGSHADAITYIAHSSAIDGKLAPYDSYHAHVCDGAKEHRLPSGYIETSILSVKTKAG